MYDCFVIGYSSLYFRTPIILLFARLDDPAGDRVRDARGLQCTCKVGQFRIFRRKGYKDKSLVLIPCLTTI